MITFIPARRWRNSLIRFQNSRRDRGSTPVVGSSRIENQKIGIVNQCAADTEFLLHAARKLAGVKALTGILIAATCYLFGGHFVCFSLFLYRTDKSGSGVQTDLFALTCDARAMVVSPYGAGVPIPGWQRSSNKYPNPPLHHEQFVDWPLASASLLKAGYISSHSYFSLALAAPRFSRVLFLGADTCKPMQPWLLPIRMAPSRC